MSYNPIPTLKTVPRYPTRSDGERLDELMQAALNGGSDMVESLNKDFIPNVNGVIPTLNTVAENLSAIIAAPGKADQAAASATAAASSASGASGSAATANAAKTAAESAKAAAQGSATSASGSAATATTKAGEAATSAATANAAKTAAESAKAAAQGSATSASGSATTATTKAVEAASSATTAINAKNAADIAKSAAETAKIAAQGSASNASDNAATATAAKEVAETAKLDAQTSARAAANSETAASEILTKVENAEISIFPPATSTVAGVVTLSSAIDSTSQTSAATPSAVQQVADIAKSAKVSSESWTLTAAVPANGQITLSRGYIVGKKEMMLFKGGLLVDYVDIGTPGKWSTVCKLVSPAAAGDVLTMVGPLEYAPSVVLDFEGGAWPKELVCTRATVDYVFDDNGKVQEVPVNTLAITKDPVTGRKGVQLFWQRTRLNKYYCTFLESSAMWDDNNNGFEIQLMRTVTDESSPTTKAIRLTFDKTRCTRNEYSYIDYRFEKDTGAVVSTKKTVYTMSICMKSSQNELVIVYIHTKNAEHSYVNQFRFDLNVTTEYTLFTHTISVQAGEYISIAPRFVYQMDKPYDQRTDGYIDVAYMQIEESSPTPLIAGPEGQQVTVGSCEITSQNIELCNQYTLYAEAAWRESRMDGNQSLFASFIEYMGSSYAIGVGALSPISEQYFTGAASVNSIGNYYHNDAIFTAPKKDTFKSACVLYDNSKYTIALNGKANNVLYTARGGFPNANVHIKLIKYADSNIHYASLYGVALSTTQLEHMTE